LNEALIFLAGWLPRVSDRQQQFGEEFIWFPSGTTESPRTPQKTALLTENRQVYGFKFQKLNLRSG
jgi:hypothetical protein